MISYDSNGPWLIVCDNESFLETSATKAAHVKARVELWHVLPRSPDLNPVELFWAKLRLWLRQRKPTPTPSHGP